MNETKRKLLAFLIDAKNARQDGRRLRRSGQGQHPAQLLRHPHRLHRLHGRPQPVKQGNFLPGTRIPIYPPEKIRETKPDYLLILPWNLKDEIMAQMAFIREWGGKFVVPLPEIKVYP